MPIESFKQWSHVYHGLYRWGEIRSITKRAHASFKWGCGKSLWSTGLGSSEWAEEGITVYPLHFHLHLPPLHLQNSHFRCWRSSRTKKRRCPGKLLCIPVWTHIETTTGTARTCLTVEDQPAKDTRTYELCGIKHTYCNYIFYLPLMYNFYIRVKTYFTLITSNVQTIYVQTAVMSLHSKFLHFVGRRHVFTLP